MALRQATERMTLDVSRLEVQTSLAVTQGDTMRRWEIKLTDRGRPIEIGSRWKAVLAGIKPDNNEIYNGCTVQDGWIIYDFATGAEIATAVGAYEIVIEVYDEEGGLLHSPKIWLTVIKGRKNISSEGQFTELQEIIRRLDETEQEVDKVALENEKQDEEIEKIKENIDTLDENKVPTTRTVNKKPLSADVDLTASDVGAAPAYTAKSMNDCATLQEIYNLFSGDYSIRLHGEVGALQNTNLKTLLGSGLAGARAFNTNYIDVYAELIGKNAGTVRLTAVDATNADNVAYGYIYFNPNLSRGGWSGWQTADYRIVDNVMEWINPPMEVGVEYRTTERHDGGVDYVKLINISALPNNSLAEVKCATTGVTKVIDYQIVASNADGTTFTNASLAPFIAGTYASVHNGNITVGITTDRDESHLTAKLFIKYQK